MTVWVTCVAPSLACSTRSVPDEDAPPIDIAALIQRADTLAPDQLPIDSLIEFAEQVYFSGKIDSARILLEAVHRGAVAQGDVSIEARALTRLGLAAWRLGDYRNAKTLGEQALEFKLQHGLTDRLFRSYNALGLLAWNEGRLTDAAELYEQAATVARETEDQAGMVAVTGNLALVRTELGEFEQ
ncbi:MAG: tetratricopeptide repeat protein, partial [Gemmatimonadetes bacterium]|nr:tetratricopeptide repeat protein [Gemmatimonadota bacterium]